MCCRADLTGICVPEISHAVVNFCAVDFLGEVLMLLGGNFYSPPIQVLAIAVKAP